MTGLPAPLRMSLALAHVAALATFAASVVSGRGLGAICAVALALGAAAALRGRTWGVGLALAASAAFALGATSSLWLFAVALAGALPFALAARPMARFDRSATVLFAALAMTAGSLPALVALALGR